MWIVVALMLFGVAGSPRSAERLVLPAARAFQASEIIADVQVHGNLVTSDEELKRLAGVDVGTPFEPSLIDAVAERLRAAKRFERVDVLKRFASIADPSQIVIVIIVDEGRVRIARSIRFARSATGGRGSCTNRFCAATIATGRRTACASRFRKRSAATAG